LSPGQFELLRGEILHREENSGFESASRD
jgi:hypothetical protein